MSPPVQKLSKTHHYRLLYSIEYSLEDKVRFLQLPLQDHFPLLAPTSGHNELLLKPTLSSFVPLVHVLLSSFMLFSLLPIFSTYLFSTFPLKSSSSVDSSPKPSSLPGLLRWSFPFSFFSMLLYHLCASILQHLTYRTVIIILERRPSHLSNGMALPQGINSSLLWFQSSFMFF